MFDDRRAAIGTEAETRGIVDVTAVVQPSTIDHSSNDGRPSDAVMVEIFVPEREIFDRHASGPLIGKTYWATPGGAVDEGETFEAAAIRELEEETGLVGLDLTAEVGRRSFELPLTSGEVVWAEERFFGVRAERSPITDTGWTENERKVMADHRWWSQQELRETSDTVFPDGLIDLLSKV